jgi:hypothetical protein
VGPPTAASDCLTEQTFQKRFPAAYRHLQSRREHLIAGPARTGSPWWVPRFRKPQYTASAPRLLAGKIGFGNNFTIDVQGCFLCHSTVVIVRPDPKVLSPYYLLGVLNSKVLSLFCQHRMPTIGPGRHICRVLGLKKFPIVLPEGPVQPTCEEIAALARGLCEGSLEGRARRDARSRIDLLAKTLYGIM